LTLLDDYAQGLARLSGDPFQAEIVRELQQTFTGDGFQRIPDKPQGDGGLDGLSHSRTRGYCCYGLELEHGPGSLPPALRKKIAEKFKADLRRVLEVEMKSKKLVHSPNGSLATVLGDPPTAKLTTMILITNIFEDKRLIGDLGTAFEEYKAASKRRFVHAKCELVIWGPIDVVNNTSVNAQSLLRVEHPRLFEAIKAAEQQAENHEPPGQEKFNQKFDDLAALTLDPDGKAEIEELRGTFKKAWSTSILLNQQMAMTLPDLHEEFDRTRRTAATEARLASNKAGVDPFALIEDAKNRLHQRMASLVNGGLPATMRDQLAEAETGRLIGECPLRWRSTG
jgi:hypothetical protein